MGGVNRYPLIRMSDLSKPYDLYGGRSRDNYLSDLDLDLSPQRAAVMNRLNPGLYSRYAKPVLEGVGNVIQAPFRGLGMGLTAAQEALAGTSDEESRLKLKEDTADSVVLDDILGRSTRPAPTPASLAIEGYKVGAQALGGLTDIRKAGALAGEDPLYREAFDRAHPVAGRVEAVAEPVANLAMQFATDPVLGLLGGMGKYVDLAETAGAALESGVLPRTAAAAAETVLRQGKIAGVAERAIGASFLPGMAEGAFEGAKQARESYGREGLSPGTFRAGTQATMDAILAGVGGYHAATGGLPTRGPTREALYGTAIPGQLWDHPYEGVMADLMGREMRPSRLLEAAPVEGGTVPPVPQLARPGAPMLTPRRPPLLGDGITDAEIIPPRQPARLPMPRDEAVIDQAIASLQQPPAGPRLGPKVAPIPGAGSLFNLSPRADAVARGPVMPEDLAALDVMIARAQPRPAPVPPAPEPVPVAPLVPAQEAPRELTAGPPEPGQQLASAGALVRKTGQGTVAALVDGLGVSPSKARRLLGQLQQQGVLEAPDARGGRALVGGPAGPPLELPQQEGRGTERRQGQTSPVIERRLAQRRQEIAAEKPNYPPEAVEDLAQADVRGERHRLTGLPERELFDQAVKEGRYQGFASADGREFGILNKTHGHVAGDAVIKAMADIIQEAVRPHGVDVYHTGGDEFRLGGKDLDIVRKAAGSAQDALRGRVLEYVGLDGKASSIPLPDVDFGYGERFPDADAELGAIKLARKRGATGLGAVAPEPAQGRDLVAPPEGRANLPAVRPAAEVARRPLSPLAEEARGVQAPPARAEGYPRGAPTRLSRREDLTQYQPHDKAVERYLRAVARLSSGGGGGAGEAIEAGRALVAPILGKPPKGTGSLPYMQVEIERARDPTVKAELQRQYDTAADYNQRSQELLNEFEEAFKKRTGRDVFAEVAANMAKAQAKRNAIREEERNYPSGGFPRGSRTEAPPREEMTPAEMPPQGALAKRPLAVVEATPPVEVGKMRLYRGNQPTGYKFQPGESGGNRFTSVLKYALRWAQEYGGHVSYVDVPENAVGELPGYEIGQWTNKVVDFEDVGHATEIEVPAAVAAQARPYIPPKTDPATLRAAVEDAQRRMKGGGGLKAAQDLVAAERALKDADTESEVSDHIAGVKAKPAETPSVEPEPPAAITEASPPPGQLAVSFDRFPAQAIRSVLKNGGFKWDADKGQWLAPWTTARESLIGQVKGNSEWKKAGGEALGLRGEKVEPRVPIEPPPGMKAAAQGLEAEMGGKKATPAPKAGRSDWTQIGQNAIGQTLYEDQRGVRSYIENGVRITQPVAMTPGRTGMGISVKHDGEWAIAGAEAKPVTPQVQNEPGQKYVLPSFATGGALEPPTGKGFQAPPATEEARARDAKMSLEEYRRAGGATPEVETTVEPYREPGWPVKGNPPHVFKKVYRGVPSPEEAATYKDHRTTAGVEESVTRYGPATYWADSKRAAEIFSEARGEGAAVEEGSIRLERPFKADNVDLTAPEFKKLRAILEREGLTGAFIHKAASDPPKFDSFTTIARQLGRPGERHPWVGANRLNALLREAGYDSIIGTMRDSLDLPNHTEFALLDDVTAPKTVVDKAPAKADIVSSHDEPAPVPSAEVAHPAGGDDRTALEGAPPEDVRAAQEGGKAPGSGVRGAGTDVGRPGRPDEQGTDLRPGVGGGPGGVGSPTERGGRTDVGVRSRDADATAPHVRDYRIQPTDEVGTGGPRQKAKANLEAIRTLKAIETDGRQASPEEQKILVKYSGWGGLPQVFDQYNRDHAGLREDLKGLLTDEEWESARGSTPNAHYTSPQVVEGMWKAIEHLGLTRDASILEPSVGAGHFFGLQPDSLLPARRTGVELDKITGRIASLLYPDANVMVKGFEATPLPDNFFDLAISNVPFGNYPVHDPKMRKQAPALVRSIHDYFFAKALDKVRPGGVVAFITSNFTMDKTDSTVRKYLASKADLLGAIRLPNTAFKASAGTEVTTDVIFLQKRMEGEAPGKIAWAGRKDVKSAKGEAISINEYFADHPEMMLGKMALEGTMYGRGDAAALVGEFSSEAMEAALKNLPKGVIKPWVAPTRPMDARGHISELPDARTIKDNGYGLKDGALVIRDGDTYRNANLPAKATATVKAMLPVRDAVRSVFKTQLEESSEADITGARKGLNKAYDAFVKAHGPLNAPENRKVFHGDPDAPLLLSLEDYNPDTKKAEKTAVFSKRTIERYKPVASAGSASEALTVSLNEAGRLDWTRMQDLTGRTPKELQEELGNLAFRNPDGGQWVTAEDYLSGDVRAKLVAAEGAGKVDKTYARNAEALRAIQPKDLETSEIDARLGSPWIPKEDIQSFVAGLLGESERSVSVSHAQVIGTWVVQLKNYAQGSVANTTEWGTERYNAHELIADALNAKVPTVYNPPDKDGKRSVDQGATLAAREQQQKIKDHFKKWLWEDTDRADRLARKYNDEFNNLRLRDYNGSHLTFPGMARATLRGGDLDPHQKNAVWRQLQDKTTLLAHVVGAGKTFEMAAAAMELRRLGLAKKPMFVVPNHLVGQWAKEFLRLYPSANVLAAGKEHFEKGKRQQIMSRIATGSYDAVIVGHKPFEALPVSDETFNSYLNEQIADLERHIEEARDAEGNGGTTVKELEKAKKRLEAKLRTRANREAKDTTITFEEMGVDAVFLDEAHLYKNLFFPTKMTRLAGVPQTESNRAFDMYIKTSHVRKLGGRVTFATGTPISNTMAEMFTMQRYLGPDMLRDRGIQHFDSWAQNFGEAVTGIELAPDGSGYRSHTRFAKFTNLPELVTMFRQMADVQTAEMLKLPTPKVEGGKRATVSAPASPALKEYVKELMERAQAVRDRKVDPTVDNMLKITGDGAKAALDMRLVQPGSEDEAGSKLNLGVRNIYDIWKETAAKRSAQLVFLDISTPAPKGPVIPASPERVDALNAQVDSLLAEGKNAEAAALMGKLKSAMSALRAKDKFSVYDDMKAKLIKRGIPEKEVAFIHDAETDIQKQAMFDAVNAGRIRVLFGSTEKMGAGTNVQRKLVALHHMDAPWRPSDIEQRQGRILRQGNENEKIRMFGYVTQGSFDAYKWQTLETKARFIGQVMQGDVSVRSAEDVAGGALTYAEVKAIASGNPAVMEKVKVDSELRKFDALRAAHQNTAVRIRRELVILPKEIATEHAQIKSTHADIADRDKLQEESRDFSMTVLGKEYAGEGARAKADEALTKALDERRGFPTPTKIGKFLNFELWAKGHEELKGVDTWLKGRERYYWNESVASAEANVRGLGDLVARREAAVAAKEKKVVDFQAQAKKPFEHEAKVAELVKKQKELDASLDLDKGDAQAAGIAEQEGAGEAQAPGEGLSAAADAAKDRIRQRGKDSTANDLGHVAAKGAGTMKDLTIIGADLFAKGARSFGEWAKRMVSDVGDFVKGLGRNLRRIFDWARTRAAREKTKPASADGAKNPDLSGGGQKRPEGVPFVITREMRTKLHDLGYTDAEVDQMKPAEAWDRIDARKRRAQPIPDYEKRREAAGEASPGGPPRAAGEPRAGVTKDTAERVADAMKEEGGSTVGKPGGKPDRGINVERIDSEDAIKEATSRLTDAMEEELTKARGYRSWKTAEEKAAFLRALGYDEKSVGRGGTFRSDAEAMAAKEILRDAIAAAKKAALRVGEAEAEGGDIAAAQQGADVAAARAAFIAAHYAKRGAETARALASMAKTASDLTPEERLIRAVFREKGAVDPEFLRAIVATNLDDMPALLKILQDQFKPSLKSKFYEWWINGLLSGPPTGIANAVSTATGLGAQVARYGITEGLESLRGARGPRAMSDAGSAILGLKDGLREAWRVFKDEVTNERFIDLQGTGMVEHHLPKIGKGFIPGVNFGKAVRTPTRVLGATDRFFKVLSANMELYRQAFERGAHLAERRGLGPGKDFDDFVTARSKEIISDVQGAKGDPKKTMHPEIVRAMKDAADYNTFNKKLGTLGNLGLRARESDPTGVLKVVVPFFRTPINIAKVTAEHTPFNFIRLMDQYRRGVLQGEPLSEELAKPILGTILGLGVALAYHEGLITGSGPADRRENDAWRATGALPYSFHVGGKYISFQRLEPFASIAGMVADLMELKDEKKQGDIVNKIVGSIGQNWTSKTFLQGVENALLAVSNPTEYASQFAKGLEGSLVPGILAKTAQAVDPVVRQTKATDLSPVMARLPFLSKRLQAKLTPTGEDTERGGSAVERFASPFYRSEDKEGKDLEREFLRIGYTPSNPSRNMTVRGRKIELNEEEYGELRRANLKAAELARRVIKSPSYRAMPDTIDEGGNRSKEYILRQYFQRAHDQFRQRVAPRVYARSKATATV